MLSWERVAHDFGGDSLNTLSLSAFIQMQAEGLRSRLIDSTLPAGCVLSAVTSRLIYTKENQTLCFTSGLPPGFPRYAENKFFKTHS